MRMLNIVKYRNIIFIISIALMVLGFAIMFIHMALGSKAFNYDVEYTGGTALVYDIQQPFNNDDVQTIVQEITGEQAPQIQKIIGTNQVSIKTKQLDQSVVNQLTDAIDAKYNIASSATSMLSQDNFSATMSGEMRNTAILAVIVACIAILLYVSLRFRNLKTGASAVIALAHDTVLVALAYAVFRIPLNDSFIAALLTILGYSINATIVIFDRVRENKSLMRRPTNEELINVSVSQTAMRCVFTSLTVLFTTVTMYIIGVPSIKDFMLPITIGVVAGTYSSIFLSGSLWYVMSTSRKVRAAGDAAKRWDSGRGPWDSSAAVSDAEKAVDSAETEKPVKAARDAAAKSSAPRSKRYKKK